MWLNTGLNKVSSIRLEKWSLHRGHRALHRDMDIVIIDEFTLRQKAMLPFGRLREPWSALKRAHVIALHEGISPQDIPTDIAHALIIDIRTEWNGVYKLTKAGLRAGNSTNNSTNNSTIQLPKQLLAVSAIAHPARFEATLANDGIQPIKHCTFADHHAFSVRELDVLKATAQQDAAVLLTTEKDLQRLPEKFPAAVVISEMTLEGPFDQMMSTLRLIRR